MEQKVVGLNALSKSVHQANVEKGFYEDHEETLVFLSEAPEHIRQHYQQAIDAQRFALIVSEVSEALESSRKAKKANIQLFMDEAGFALDDETFKEAFEENIKDSEEDEVADAVIRLFDYAGSKGMDLEFHVEKKLQYNSLRPHKHAKKY